MSDGFKSIFVLLFDLIVRAWEKGADINSWESLHGVVLIDEIDLHLHSSWQRTILPALVEAFPNIQFIITTHSPYVVQSMKTNNIIVLNVEAKKVVAKKVKMEGKPYGQEIEKIIEDVIGGERKIPGISTALMELLQDFEKAVENGDKKIVTDRFKMIKEIIPSDSNFWEYLKIMSAGLLDRDGV
jgi:predicted ATP-binding protein involved in virulence